LATDVTAPSQLPAKNTGAILKIKDCFDLDSVSILTDAKADICIDANGLVSGRNGALFAQSGRLALPSKAICMADKMDTSGFSPLTDLNMCFKTNQGSYGYFVMRMDQLMDRQQIVFDWWIFPNSYSIE